MSCCSGDKQAKRLTAFIAFRPAIDQQFTIQVALRGVDGVWKGRTTESIEFDDTVSCGSKPPIGTQDVTMKLSLKCTEGSQLAITGSLEYKLAGIINKFTLRPAIMDCPDGGPKCTIEWPSLFLGEYLGNASITIREFRVGDI